MNDLSQPLGSLPPVVGNVLREFQAGNHAAVPDADAQAAAAHVTSQLEPRAIDLWVAPRERHELGRDRVDDRGTDLPVGSPG